MPALPFCCPKWQWSSWVWLLGARRTGKLMTGSGSKTPCLHLLKPIWDHSVISAHAALERCGGIKASIPRDWCGLWERYGNYRLGYGFSEGETT